MIYKSAQYEIDSSDDILNKAKQDGYEIVSEKQSLTNVKKTDKLIGLFAEDSLTPELDREKTDKPSLQEMTSAAIENTNFPQLMAEAMKIPFK